MEGSGKVVMSEENFKNPRKLLNAWEAQALATLTSKGLPNSFKAITELMRDESQDAEAITAAEILFWGRVWRQSKTKEEVVTSWNHLLRLIKHNNYQGIASYEDGKKSMEGADERVDLPVQERILELIEEGLSPEEVIMRGFSFEKVTEAIKNGA
jgi:Txe/YoeB family toxin of Txe-Axe toxin-antitoxin module|tara:strand:- start:304 stop:768 length:465 start_codon:yes stop_codon:yes gene_type:complete